MADEAATPVLDLLATMTEAAVETSSLDPAAQILLRFAALVALDAAPAFAVSLPLRRRCRTGPDAGGPPSRF